MTNWIAITTVPVSASVVCNRWWFRCWVDYDDSPLCCWGSFQPNFV